MPAPYIGEGERNDRPYTFARVNFAPPDRLPLSVSHFVLVDTGEVGCVYGPRLALSRRLSGGNGEPDTCALLLFLFFVSVLVGCVTMAKA